MKVKLKLEIQLKSVISRRKSQIWMANRESLITLKMWPSMYRQRKGELRLRRCWSDFYLMGQCNILRLKNCLVERSEDCIYARF